MMTVFAHFNCHTVTVTKVLCVFFMFVLLKLVHWTTFGNSDLQHYRTRFRNRVPGCNYLGTRTQFQIQSDQIMQVTKTRAWGVEASQLMILVVSLTKDIEGNWKEILRELNDEVCECEVKSTLELQYCLTL